MTATAAFVAAPVFGARGILATTLTSFGAVGGLTAFAVFGALFEAFFGVFFDAFFAVFGAVLAVFFHGFLADFFDAFFVFAVFLAPRALGDTPAQLLALAAEQGVQRAVLLSGVTVEHGGGHRRFADQFKAVEDAVKASGLQSMPPTSETDGKQS